MVSLYLMHGYHITPPRCTNNRGLFQREASVMPIVSPELSPLARGAFNTALSAVVMRPWVGFGQGGAAMSFYERGPVRIKYEEAGSGFPLLLIPGGGLNSTIALLKRGRPFNSIEEFKGEYRCIFSDMRNANGGESSGPLEIDRPWDAYTDDHIGLMDHLGIDKFVVMGFCIGGPLVWNLLKRAPDRIVAAVLAQPSGFRPEMPNLSYDNNIKGWGPELVQRRPDVTMETVDKFLTKMYRANPDFVWTVTREFVRHCSTPVLILPDDIPPHPYAVAMEAAMLAPKGEVSMFPWKEPKERVPLAVRQIRSFLRAHRLASD
jgi:pimeloyl-ACP methyl ester carboxylesterase